MAKADTIHKPNKRLIQKISKIIRTERNKKGLTLEELGNMSGINYKYIQRIETLKVNPSVSILHSLCKALKMNIKDLF
ncbi:MAG: helix-turn-helix transcriptional regulator [Elusimicrobiaceae bacterium]|jgi:transcriptional regulator with XRE-family HTH domain|nr:helix-turn-helix transcriptional regulator [Elusimicrobiaceae bacterium]MBT3955524.1 helix-turn-helix transcriptional regulator [Elusimicrobiaceae bacterium]MBT4008151.1 helix-turn-helix transcriptional regulator [Elusimicrobiaceae bacterium]MBT4402549.1 helix-turn-helix transcriptional regulator [Elusimicrobiaceae bacterium]MBT4439676.1 helix-turn-helix transcriptional regulator [Elusimicrobiaceae bacterium]